MSRFGNPTDALIRDANYKHVMRATMYDHERVLLALSDGGWHTKAGLQSQIRSRVAAILARLREKGVLLETGHSPEGLTYRLQHTETPTLFAMKEA